NPLWNVSASDATAGANVSGVASFDVSSNNTTWTNNVSALPSGTSYVRVHVHDQAGNDAVSNSRQITYTANPTTYAVTGQQRTEDPEQTLRVPFGRALIDPNLGDVQLTQPFDFDLSPGAGVGGSPQLV